MNCVVYTAVLGETDTLRDPSFLAPGVKYSCFTDRPLTTSSWQRVEIPTARDSVTAARHVKIMSAPPEADFTLWIDSAFRLEVDPVIFAPLLLRADLLAFRHPWCSTLEDEICEISGRGLVPEAVLKNQLSDYSQAGFPSDTPHSSTGFLVRRNDLRTRTFNRTWWAELTRHGHPRDQMSFDYAAWRCGMRIHYLEGQYRDNPYATWGPVAAKEVA